MNPRSDNVALRNYEFFCLASLLVLVLVLFQRDVGFLSLLPFLIGLGGIAGRWRYANALLLASLVVLLTEMFSPWRSYLLWEEDALTDGLLAAAVLGYVAGQLRLQALAGPIGEKRAATVRERSAALPYGRGSLNAGPEIGVLVISSACCVVLAQFAWEQLPDRGYGLGISLSAWRLIVLTWLLGMGGIVGAGLVTYVNRKHRTPAEAAMFLQDLFWRETRGEQRRLYRWFAWRRLRIARRKERS